MSVEKVLAERGTRYGNYLEQTKISNAIIEAYCADGNVALWDLETDQRDALMMIAVKISRILNGDPDYADNWSDIAGYATLVEKRLSEKNSSISN